MWRDFMIERAPKDVLVGVYSPGRKLFEFSVWVRNVPGAIAEVSGCLAKNGVNLLSGFHKADPSTDRAHWGFIADLAGSKIRPPEVLRKIKALKAVLDANMAEARFNGLIVDEIHFPLTALGERSLLLKVETWGDMSSRLFEAFGSGANVILYEMGLKAGENKAKNIFEKYGRDRLKALQIIMAERVAKGWGIPKIEEFKEDKLEAKISVQDLFECLPYKGKLSQTKSHFFRGYLTGAFNHLFRKKATVTEVKCIAKADENCQFEIK
jgi:predicted hydrocarbon binding protein